MTRWIAAAAVLASLALIGCRDMGSAGANDGGDPKDQTVVGVKTGSEKGRYTDTLPRFDPKARDGWPALLVEWAEKATKRYDAPTLTASAVAGLDDDVLIVDVREAREIGVSRIKGSMPLSSQIQRLEFIRKAKGKTVVVYCTVGWRSAEFAARLEEEGVDAYNLDGGLCGWAAAGQQIVNAMGLATNEIHAYNEDFAGAVPDGFEPRIRP